MQDFGFLHFQMLANKPVDTVKESHFKWCRIDAHTKNFLLKWKYLPQSSGYNVICCSSMSENIRTPNV